MMLSISTTMVPATDLGYLLHKNPGRVHGFELSFGRATARFGYVVRFDGVGQADATVGAPTQMATFEMH